MQNVKKVPDIQSAKLFLPRNILCEETETESYLLLEIEFMAEY